jgi:putative glycosyltransferase
MQPLISVIVPVYNVAPYLRQCVDSILTQSYPHLEVLLIDDGSTDDGGAICDEYALQDSRVKVVHKSNGGLSSARNVGLSLASGGWISFVDSDDWLDTNIYQKCIDELERYPDLDLVRFFINDAYLEKGSNSYRLEPWKEAQDSLVIDKSTCFRYPGRLPGIVWSSIYRTSVLKSLRITFIEGLIHEDEYFTAELYARAKSLKGRYIPFYGYYYRKNREGAITHNDNSIKSFENLSKGFISVLRRMQSVDAEVVPLLNTHFLAVLEESLGWSSNSSASPEQMVQAMQPFLKESYKYKLAGACIEKRILLRLFRWNPIVASKVLRWYKPIARRLGSRVYV